MSELDVSIAKTAKLSLKGLPKCAPADLRAQLPRQHRPRPR